MYKIRNGKKLNESNNLLNDCEIVEKINDFDGLYCDHSQFWIRNYETYVSLSISCFTCSVVENFTDVSKMVNASNCVIDSIDTIMSVCWYFWSTKIVLGMFCL